MRFVVTGEWRENRLLALVIFWFLLFGVGIWLTNLLLYFDQMGLTSESVLAHYRGVEEQFLLPRSYRVLLEISHFHLLAMSLFLLTLAHLMLFLSLSSRIKSWLVNLTFFSALSDEAAGWLIRFVHPWFACYKIGAFLLFQATLAILIGAVLVDLLLFNARKGNAGALPNLEE